VERGTPWPFYFPKPQRNSEMESINKQVVGVFVRAHKNHGGDAGRSMLFYGINNLLRDRNDVRHIALPSKG